MNTISIKLDATALLLRKLFGIHLSNLYFKIIILNKKNRLSKHLLSR